MVLVLKLGKACPVAFDALRNRLPQPLLRVRDAIGERIGHWKKAVALTAGALLRAAHKLNGGSSDQRGTLRAPSFNANPLLITKALKP